MKNAGLEDVVVADSAICSIDGEKGELRYRGYSVEELVAQSDFAETAALLADGDLPVKNELDRFRRDLRAKRNLSQEAGFLVHGLATRTDPMDALRTIVSAMSADDPTPQGRAPSDLETSRQRAIRMTALLPTAIAVYARVRDGKPVVPPNPDLGHAANFLWMLRGDEPSDEEADIFDKCLILHAEHGLNASTFAARVVASTLTDIYSAVCAAIGSLKGPLHGGANTRVMQMLIDLGDESNVGPFLDRALAEKQRVMGFGHRVYKTSDPRARLLEQYSERLSRLKGEPKWYRLSAAVEREMHERKGLVTNVDFYSASTYYYLGIPPDLYTPIFALARITGWTAHILEQYGNNRLMRPRARWVGPELRPYLPLDRRG